MTSSHPEQGDNRTHQVGSKKSVTTPSSLCNRVYPSSARAIYERFTDAVLMLKFDEEPKYSALIALFEPLVTGAVGKPLMLEPAHKVNTCCVLVMTPRGLGFFQTVPIITWSDHGRSAGGQVTVLTAMYIARTATCVPLLSSNLLHDQRKTEAAKKYKARPHHQLAR